MGVILGVMYLTCRHRTDAAKTRIARSTPHNHHANQTHPSTKNPPQFIHAALRLLLQAGTEDAEGEHTHHIPAGHYGAMQPAGAKTGIQAGTATITNYYNSISGIITAIPTLVFQTHIQWNYR